MLGALGGLTVVIALLNKDVFRPSTAVFWVLFAVVGLFAEGVIP